MGRQSIKKKESKMVVSGTDQIVLPQLHLPASKSFDISFENISYSVSTSYFSKKRKEILKGVSGSFNAGELTAVMGPSGAGKSSLLNVLSGFFREGIKGCIYANGVQVDGKRSQTKSHSSYIMQDDQLDPSFTVQETMLYAADLNLGYSTSHKSKLLLIEDILDSMAMSEAKNTYCKLLSGGQRKRLSVCLEIVNNPSMLFLDEPTSGLDSLSSSLLINKLKALARSGRTVVCTIHQPSAGIFSMFDHIYILSSGKNIYQGNTNNILPFLNYVGLECPMFHNPADYIMDIISGDFGNYTDKLIAANRSQDWRSIKSYNKTEKESEPNKLEKNNSLCISKSCPSEWIRYICLTSKMIKQVHREWSSFYARLVIHALVGIFVGLLFQGMGTNGGKVISNVSYYFVCILYLCFTTMMPAALTFPTQVKVLKKEHFNNWYKFSTYFIALLTIHLPIQLTFVILYSGISFFLTSQKLELIRYALFTIGLAFIGIISQLIGLFMGTMAQPVNGIFNGSVLLAIMCLLGGFFAFFNDMPGKLYIASYFGFFRYVLEIMVASMYGLGRDQLECPSDYLYCHLRHPQTLMELLGFDDKNITMDLLILVVYTIIVASVTFLRLKYTLKYFPH